MFYYLNNGILYSGENERIALFSFVWITFKYYSYVGRKK